MKIYFGFTMCGDRHKLGDVKKAVALLKEKGHEILTDHVFDENFKTREHQVTNDYVYEYDMERLQKADIVIMEVSGSSFGIGFEAGFSLASGKKVYMFYDKNLVEKISKMALGNTHSCCIRVPYSNFQEVIDFIEKEF